MSSPPKVERKTKAIMFTDIAGYTKAMSESEQKALEMLRKKRSIIKTLIDEKLTENAQIRGNQLMNGLNDIKNEFSSKIKIVRGKGLLTAFEMFDDKKLDGHHV